MVLFVSFFVNMISVLKWTSCWELIVLRSKLRIQMRCMNADSREKSFTQCSVFLEDIRSTKWAQWSCHHSKHFLRCFFGNSASASHSFVWIMVISLNSPSFNLIFRYGTRKKSHGTDSGDEGRCEMTVILFSQKLGHKAEWVGALS
jgi:hypothetical protein